MRRTPLLPLLVLLAMTAVARAQPINADQGLAIHGLDPVAYFTDGRPIAGDPAITAEWQGAHWRFASTAHRDTFLAAPERYAPAYGGHCAYGVSRGYLVDIDPEAWTIRDGTLYLNYSLPVRTTWLEDPAGYIEKADGNWPGLARTP
jgi:hypothetical protein